MRISLHCERIVCEQFFRLYNSKYSRKVFDGLCFRFYLSHISKNTFYENVDWSYLQNIFWQTVFLSAAFLTSLLSDSVKAVYNCSSDRSNEVCDIQLFWLNIWKMEKRPWLKENTEEEMPETAQQYVFRWGQGNIVTSKLCIKLIWVFVDIT